MSSMHNSVQKQGKALKRFLQGKDRGKKVNLRPRQQTVDTPDGAAGALIGTDITRDAVSLVLSRRCGMVVVDVLCGYVDCAARQACQ